MSFTYHFIHLYFFTEFEIFFYIYYILPYEKDLVYNMFSKKNLLNGLGYSDDFFNNLINNIKSQDYNYNKQCSLEQDRINANHDKLWTYCFIYIMLINVLMFLLFIKDFAICYRDFIPFSRTISNSDNSNNNTSGKSLASLSSPSFSSQSKYKKTDFDFDLEMISIDLETNKISNDETSNNISIIKNTSFCTYYWNRSEFLAATYKTIQFIILIGIFEYLFFSIIINKYKVVSAKLLLCKLLET